MSDKAFQPLNFVPAWAYTPCQVKPERFEAQAKGNGRRLSSEARLARALCLTCVAIEPCREWGIEHLERWGMWGGLTYGERAKVRRERGLPVEDEWGEDELADAG